MRGNILNHSVFLKFRLVVHVFICNLAHCLDWWNHLLQYVAVCSCRATTVADMLQGLEFWTTANHFLKLHFRKLCLRIWRSPLTWHDWLQSDGGSEVWSSSASFPLRCADTRRYVVLSPGTVTCVFSKWACRKIGRQSFIVKTRR